MIDFHCHLDLYADPSRVIARCESENVHVLSVTTVPSAFEGTSALASPGSCIKTALGLHPELASERYRELPLFETLLVRTRFVGEVGLDGSSRYRDTLSRQEGVLQDILRMCASAGGRVLSVHSRGAAGKILDVLSAHPKAGEFVLHWYTGNERQIDRAVEMGCWFSVNPAMLLRKKGRIAVALMPRNRIVPESDGPFGMIEGRPAQPWDAWSIITGLSSCWRVSTSEVADRLTASYFKLLSRFPSD